MVCAHEGVHNLETRDKEEWDHYNMASWVESVKAAEQNEP